MEANGAPAPPGVLSSLRPNDMRKWLRREDSPSSPVRNTKNRQSHSCKKARRNTPRPVAAGTLQHVCEVASPGQNSSVDSTPGEILNTNSLSELGKAVGSLTNVLAGLQIT